MKKMKFIWLFVLFTAGSLSVQAADMKIGFVNAAAVMENSPQYTQALTKLENEFASRRKTIESKIRDLKKRQERLEKDAAILSSQERREKERDIVSAQRDIKRLQDEFKDDFTFRRTAEGQKIEKEVAETIQQVAKQESYDMIVYQGVIYASDRADITQKVLKILKDKAK